MVKNTSFCKSTGKDECSTSTMAMIRSVTLPEITASVKKNEMFKNRKRKSENGREFACGTTCNTEVLTSTCDRQKSIESSPNVEIEYCNNALNSINQHKETRQSNTLSKFVSGKDKEKRQNTSMMIKGVSCTLLVLGKVQIGTIHNDQRELLIEELFLRGIVVDPKEKIKALKEKITSNECQN